MGTVSEDRVAPVTTGPEDRNTTKNRDGTRTVEPLYLRVARSIRTEILNGAYPVGAQIPTEDVLRERFAVSRFTVREAIRRLREEGLVSSRQGAGTIVAPPPMTDATVLNTVSIGDIVTFGNDTRLVIDAVRLLRVDAKLASRLGVERSEEWLFARGTRRGRGDTPICAVEYYIHRDFAGIGRQVPRARGPIFQLIEDVFAVTIAEVRQEIVAVVLSPTAAAELQADPGAAALEIRRIYRLDDDRVAQITFNLHPASTYRHSMTMRRVRS